MHCCDGVEGLGREHNLATVTECYEEAEREAKAVEERRWTAECVVWCQVHAVADEARVIDEVTACCISQCWSWVWCYDLLVRQHGSFWVAGAAAREL